jgi:hypothetical protein
LNALVAEYQRAFGLGLEGAADVVLSRAVVVLPALSFISSVAPDVAPVDPLLFPRLTATVSDVARSVADRNDARVVAEKIVVSLYVAAAARTAGATRSRSRRRKDATLRLLQRDRNWSEPAG